MSELGLEGPPEQETNIPEANTRTIDKWAQEEIYRPKGKVMGPLGGRQTTLVAQAARGPHRLNLATWRELIGCLHWFGEDQLQNGLPLAVAPSYK